MTLRWVRDEGKFTTGSLILAAGGTKHPEHSSDKHEVFYVAEGKVRTTIYNSEAMLSAGDYFFVPPNNTYSISNLSQKKEATLVYFIRH